MEKEFLRLLLTFKFFFVLSSCLFWEFYASLHYELFKFSDFSLIYLHMLILLL